MNLIQLHANIRQYLSTFNRTSDEDPLKSALFRIEMDGFTRLGFSEATMPKAMIEKSEYREGGENLFVRKSPGLGKVEDIELKRGVLVVGPNGDDFERWFNQVLDLSAGKATAKTFRKNIDYVLLKRDLTPAIRFRLFEAWPHTYVPGVDMKGTDMATDHVQSLSITFERFRRVLD